LVDFLESSPLKPLGQNEQSTNQKQEMPVAAKLVNGSEQNELSL
jgi:hypothetical protein